MATQELSDRRVAVDRSQAGQRGGSIGLVLLMVLGFGVLKFGRKSKAKHVKVNGDARDLPAGEEFEGAAALPGGEDAVANIELSAKAQQLAAGPPLFPSTPPPLPAPSPLPTCA